MSEQEGVSRRGFLKGLVAAAGAVAVAPIPQETAIEEITKLKDELPESIQPARIWCKVISSIIVDGLRYRPGDWVAIPWQQWQSLAEDGAVRAMGR